MQQIEQVLGCSLAVADQAAPRVSGSLDAHYAPHTPLALIGASDFATTVAALVAKRHRVASLCIDAAVADATRMPADPQQYAQVLYAQLRQLDQAGADLILVEQPPQSAEWQGINDRLRRAAFDSAGVLQRLLEKSV
jgi:L-threonylcarbamoyladenylate synthase